MVPFSDTRDAVASRLIEDVGESGARWRDLLGALANLPPAQVDLSVRTLEDMLPARFSVDERALVWASLRSVIARHRWVPEAGRVLPTAVVDRLERVYQHLAPHDTLQRVAWLFSRSPEVPPDAQTLRQAQEDAVCAVYKDGGLQGYSVWR